MITKRKFAAVCCFGLVEGASVAVFLGTNSSSRRSLVDPWSGAGRFGTSACPCVGVDNLQGYYATQQDAYHVQYTADAGSTCGPWDMGMHPKCKGAYYEVPEWCRQSWCYVDPCKCNLDIVPKMTNAGIEYQGAPAYWSYHTCGGSDTYTEEMNLDACIMQKTEALCSANPNGCAWNGKMCVGKELVGTCSAKKDTSLYGQEDCRCIGIGGRQPGKAFMYIDEQRLARYSPDVGSSCRAWEMEAHPRCLQSGDKPGWCSMKWCFVDPCKCKVKNSAVMGRNQDMRFQGKRAFWSAETCGNAESFYSTDSAIEKATRDICEEQARSGQLPSGAFAFEPCLLLVAVLAAISDARVQ